MVIWMDQITRLTIFQSCVFHCVDNIYTKKRDEMNNYLASLYEQNNLLKSGQKCWLAAWCSGGNTYWNPKDLDLNSLSLSVYLSAEIGQTQEPLY